MLWQVRLLNALAAFDLEESPHGIYGIREAYASEAKPLPTMEKILWSRQPPGFVERYGFGVSTTRRVRRGSLSIGENRSVSLKFLDVAFTKVRQFGSTYLLDKSSPKRAIQPDWDITKELTHLSQCRYPFGKNIPAVLLIAHAPRLEVVYEIIGDVRTAAFVNRYQLEFHEREWSDQLGRGFLTGLYLWNLKISDGTP